MLAALGCGALATTGPVRAADAVWNGSYAADGACHCAGELDPGVAARRVDTPAGRRSVERVCAAVGAGPGLSVSGGLWSHVVYPDSQCGNGPFASGVELLDAECAGTRRPGESDCRPVGPGWDLESAFAAVPDEADEQAPAAVATIAPDADATRTIEIDGLDWRRAPDDTPRSGGRAGSRIIVDGEVWLRADDPRFAEVDVATVDAATEETRRAALRAEAGTRETDYVEVDVVADASGASGPASTTASNTPSGAAAPAASPAVTPRVATTGRHWEEAPAEPAGESPEAFRERQRALMAEARARDQEVLETERGSPPSTDLADADAGIDTDGAPASGDPVLAAALPGVEPATAPTDEIVDPAIETSAGSVAATAPGEASAEVAAAPLAAMRLPGGVRGSSDEFGYVEAMPKNYEIGGAGIGLEASGEAAGRFHFLARAGAAEAYQEIALGAGMHVTPPDADRLTFSLTGGVEYGTFELVATDAEGRQIQSIDDAEAGLWLAVSSRLVVNSRFELSGGVGYSSFHEGDPHGFGGAFFHVNRRLDLMSRFEIGDNDQLGIGLRYYY